MPKTMAEQALDILDRTGEFALVAYLATNAFPDITEKAWRNDGYCLLYDQSYVKHIYLHASGPSYHFNWTERSGQERHHRRRAAMKPWERPQLAGHHPPLITGMNQQTLFEAVVDLVSEQGTPPEKRLENEGAFRAAPDLYETIRAVRENANRDERARDRRMLERLAGTVLEMLPDEQIEQLKEEAAYVARLE